MFEQMVSLMNDVCHELIEASADPVIRSVKGDTRASVATSQQKRGKDMIIGKFALSGQDIRQGMGRLHVAAFAD